MTLYEFRCALRDIRDNRKRIKSILISINNKREDGLSTIFSGAIDYSVERVQHQMDPDARIINAIDKIDRDIERDLKLLDELQSEGSAHLEQLIYEADGIGAEAVRLYVMEGYSWKEVGIQLKYSESYCHDLWCATTKQMFEKYEANL